MKHFKLLTTTLISAALMSGAAIAQPGNLTVENDAEIHAEGDAGMAADHGVDMRAEAGADTGIMAKRGMNAAAGMDPREFAQEAAMAGQYELESSRLALENAQNDDVRKFAQKVIDDHKRSNEKLKTALREQGLDPAVIEAELDDAHQQKLEKLRNKIGAPDFDEEYMDAQEVAHDDTIKLYERFTGDVNTEANANAAANVNANANVDAENRGALAKYARESLPVLREHREMADTIEKQVATWR